MGWRPLFILDKKRVMSKISIAERIQKIAASAADDNGFELVHVEVVGSEKQPIVRIFIDKPEGVTIDDCTTMSHTVGTILDAEDFISSAYMLEVSSPGLERQLYSLKDFEKFAGNLARVKTNVAINGQRNFRGRIKSVDGEEIVFDDKTNGEVHFAYNAVAKANLEIDIEEEFKRNEKLKAESGK